ncbi:unnamed protein product [Adineta ricciae]|uniref:Uncharacterized protein n=1 Tax=Adineta ricciae TaxID=249248 RepID=A0A815TIB0_ADIRI|nr:unnamed protein product [Adineta ricciae]
MKSNKQELYKVKVYNPAPNCSKPAQAPGTQSRTTYLCNRKRTSMYIVLSPVPLILIALVVMIPTVFVARKTKTTAAPIPITTVTTVTMSTTTTQTTTPTETRTTETTIYKSDGKKYLKWKQQATTVAGGNGNQFNQLSSPYGISVGQNKTIIIADYGNDRVVRWEWQAKKGTIVAGGKGRGNRTDQLHSPRDVIVAKDNQSIIIVDYSNRRVIRWFDQSPLNQQILINDIDCYGLAMDKEGYLYVSDVRKQEVRRWKEGESQGTIVAGGNGLGNRLNQLKWPSYLFVDDEQSIYVSDHGNHRVMKWRKDAKEGSIVAGGNREGNSLNQLWHPEGVIVDRWGQIYVADLGNNRVMRWREGDKEGGIVVGGNGYGQRLDQLSYPTGLSFDDEGNLYVADCGNDRIQKFDLILS